MRSSISAGVLAAALLASADMAIGQVEQDSAMLTEDLELTMRLMPRDADRPETITKTIALPPAAAGRRDAADHMDDDDTTDDRGQHGQDIAEQAREKGREFGQEMSERARENREDATRGEPPIDPPGPPDDPGPPDGLPGSSD